ncbi:MAG TPA: alpha/beta fold hydrolase [Chloroflexi bacterium]|nr:alpha/beta fold hydrolase [Chloroflexota bacterium]
MFIETNSARLYYEEAGAGSAVVLLHGFTLDTRMWDDQFLALAQCCRVIRYDLRGFGRSSLPAAPYSHVEDLRGLLDQLGIEQATLVALSKGGGVALDFALSYPQRTRRLALIDTILGGHVWSEAGSARDALVWQEAKRGGIPAAKASWLAHPLFAPAMRQPEVAARLTQIIEDYSGWHFVNRNPEQSLQPPALGRLHTLTMPILVIVGEHDLPDFQHIAATIGQRAPDVRTLVVSGAGHMANMEAPAVVNAALLEFLLSG